jgi:hypothetical protein
VERALWERRIQEEGRTDVLSVVRGVELCTDVRSVWVVIMNALLCLCMLMRQECSFVHVGLMSKFANNEPAFPSLIE